MKTTRPTIKAAADRSKKRTDGTSPVYIFVNWRGRAKEATGVYVTDNTPEKKITNNKAIKARMAELELRVYELQQGGKEYTAADVLAKADGKATYYSIMRQMIRDKRLTESTQNNHKNTYDHLVEEYGKDFYINKLTLNNIQGFARHLKRTLKAGTINTILTCIHAVLSYAVSEGIEKQNVMDGWNFRADGYKKADRPKALNVNQLTQIIEKWEKTNDLGLGIFLAGYYFSGLALCDLVRVDWENVEEIWTDCQFYYYTTINRQKTNELATIMTPKFDTTEKLMDMLKTKPWSGKKFEAFQKYVRVHIQLYFPDVTYYMARHSFCTYLVNSNVAISDIATLMGRNVNTIGTYIKQVTTAEHLSNAVKCLTFTQQGLEPIFCEYDD